VKLSTHARDLHRAEADQQPSAQEHIERINAITRSDEMAHAKLAESAKEEAKALVAKQKEDEQFYKRINTFA
jgi:branched-subunit amino acid aminotransferase/4-amino-4-deoxychorismate lyase